MANVTITGTRVKTATMVRGSRDIVLIREANATITIGRVITGVLMAIVGLRILVNTHSYGTMNNFIGNNVYVAGIPRRVTEEDLRRVFVKYGPIIDI